MTYMMHYDVKVLKIWHIAYHDNRDAVALQIALLEERKMRRRLAKGRKGASALLAAALWCTAESFMAMERDEEARRAGTELLSMLESGLEIGSISPATVYLCSGTLLHDQTIDLKNSGNHEGAQGAASECLQMMYRCAGIVDDRRCVVVTAMALCFEVLGQRDKGTALLLSFLKDIERSSLRNTGFHCDILDQLSELHYRRDCKKGLLFARKANVIASLLGDAPRQRNALYSMSIHLHYRGPEWDKFAKFYSTINKICRICRTIEGGKYWLKEMVFGPSDLGQSLTKNSAEALRTVACRKNYCDVLWGLRSAGVHLNRLEKEIKDSATPPLRKQCSYCALVVPLRRCSNCKVVYYCSAECQSDDWINHRRVCHKMLLVRDGASSNLLT